MIFPCSAFVRVCATLAVLAPGSGCVMTSDLERLNRELSQKIEAAERTVRGDVATLREEVAAARISNDELGGKLTTAVDALRADTREAVDTLAADEETTAQQLEALQALIVKTRQAVGDYVATSNQALEQIALLTAEVNTKLTTIEETVPAMQRLAPAIGQLREGMRALRQALLAGYELEAAALEHRLHALEEVTRQLEPAAQAKPERQ